MCAGNKADLEAQRAVPTEEAQVGVVIAETDSESMFNFMGGHTACSFPFPNMHHSPGAGLPLAALASPMQPRSPNNLRIRSHLCAQDSPRVIVAGREMSLWRPLVCL